MVPKETHRVNAGADFDHGVSREGNATTRLFRVFLWAVPIGSLFTNFVLWLTLIDSGLPVSRTTIGAVLLILHLAVSGVAGFFEGTLRWRGNPGKIAAATAGFVFLQAAIPLACILAEIFG